MSCFEQKLVVFGLGKVLLGHFGSFEVISGNFMSVQLISSKFSDIFAKNPVVHMPAPSYRKNIAQKSTRIQKLSSSKSVDLNDVLQMRI